MSEHTKEPWTYQKECVGNYQIAHDHSGAGTLEVTANTITEANARRIVACVNACAEIDTEVLEKHAGQQGLMIYLMSDLVKQRDELLAALKEARLFIPEKTNNSTKFRDYVDELIAKVESEK